MSPLTELCYTTSVQDTGNSALPPTAFSRTPRQYSQRSIHMSPFLSLPEGAEPSVEDVEVSPLRGSSEGIPQITPPITPERERRRDFPPARSPFAYRPTNRTGSNAETNILPIGVQRPPPFLRRGGIRGRGTRRRREGRRHPHVGMSGKKDGGWKKCKKRVTLARVSFSSRIKLIVCSTLHDICTSKTKPRARCQRTIYWGLTY